MTSKQMMTGIGIMLSSLAEAENEKPEAVPLGTIYAGMMSYFGLAEFQIAIATLKRAGLVVVKGQLLELTDDGREQGLKVSEALKTAGFQK